MSDEKSSFKLNFTLNLNLGAFVKKSKRHVRCIVYFFFLTMLLMQYPKLLLMN